MSDLSMACLQVRSEWFSSSLIEFGLFIKTKCWISYLFIKKNSSLIEFCVFMKKRNHNPLNVEFLTFSYKKEKKKTMSHIKYINIFVKKTFILTNLRYRLYFYNIDKCYLSWTFKPLQYLTFEGICLTVFQCNYFANYIAMHT